MIKDKCIENIKFCYEQYDGAVVMKWLGESSMQYPQKFLNPYFTEMISSIAEFKSVIVDFRQLDYMNSGTVQPILHLIKGLNSLNKPIIIYYNKEKKWQTLSFQALKAVTKILKNVSLEAK